LQHIRYEEVRNSLVLAIDEMKHSAKQIREGTYGIGSSLLDKGTADHVKPYMCKLMETAESLEKVSAECFVAWEGDMEPPDLEEYFYSEDHFFEDGRLQIDSEWCEEHGVDYEEILDRRMN